MASGVLGRTNRVFPSIWLSLSQPTHPDGLNSLVAAAIATGAPIDVTSQPALWGGKLRGSNSTLLAIGSADYEYATSEDHAFGLTQANLVELLSCIGRETIDIFYFRVRTGAQEYQISGALRALELAKQDGHVRYIGLCCDGPPLITLGLWQFHDAFEILLVPRNHYDSQAYDTLAPLAKERRVGVVTSRPLNWGQGSSFTECAEHWRLRNLTQSFYGHTLAQAALADLTRDHPVLVGVRTAAEVEQAVATPHIELRPGLRAMLGPFIESFDPASREMGRVETR